VPVISITPYKEGTLVFAEFFMNKSRNNLAHNDKVGVAVLTEGFEGWSLKGTFLGFERQGEAFETISQLPLLRYNAYTSARAAGVIRVEEVSGRQRLSKSRLLCAFVHATALATLRRRGHNGSQADDCMPRQVEDKFRRMSAVRAIAYRDRDGFPRVFGLIACVSSGSSWLLAADPLFRPWRSGLEPGATVAASVITQEPIAYQVKGMYEGRRLGADLIELTACYSASPPLLGERLDGRAIAAGRQRKNLHK
jgi:hypothetical protein